jgi:hypothetical protein
MVTSWWLFVVLSTPPKSHSPEKRLGILDLVIGLKLLLCQGFSSDPDSRLELSHGPAIK